MRLGVITSIEGSPQRTFAHVRELDLPTCQLAIWEPERYSDELVAAVRSASEATGVEVSTVWAGWSGPRVWNLTEGPLTLGIVPPKYRRQRVLDLKRGADFAAAIGAPSITTHVGFIPELPTDPEYDGVVAALQEIVDHCRRVGVGFWFETGQETPFTLLRTIQRLGEDGVGLNLDPANLILYGRANPVDALDLVGRYVRGVHIKDGLYPADGMALGRETPVGEGKVDFPALLAGLKGYGFDGALTIEREISGPKQIEDIIKARDYIRTLL